eukprot:8284601-Pyramimonas_sp.AAC.1
MLLCRPLPGRVLTRKSRGESSGSDAGLQMGAPSRENDGGAALWETPPPRTSSHRGLGCSAAPGGAWPAP